MLEFSALGEPPYRIGYRQTVQRQGNLHMVSEIVGNSGTHSETGLSSGRDFFRALRRERGDVGDDWREGQEIP